MKKFLFKITVYSIVILLISNGIALLSLYFLGQSNFYKPQFLKNGVKETHFDYVVLGSSTGLTTLNTKQIDAALKTSGLNISMDDTSLNTHFLMLQFFYQQKKTTDYLILAVSPWDMENETPLLSDNDYRFFSENNIKEVRNYYQTITYKEFPVLKYSAYLPILGVAYYNAEVFYPSIFTIVNSDKRNRFDDRGNYSYPGTGGPKDVVEQNSLTEVNNPYFEKIKVFCEQKGISLILYQSPSYKKKVDYSLNELIINHSDFLKNKNLFYDNRHVNKRGRTVCSADFSVQFARVLKNSSLK